LCLFAPGNAADAISVGDILRDLGCNHKSSRLWLQSQKHATPSTMALGNGSTSTLATRSEICFPPISITLETTSGMYNRDPNLKSSQAFGKLLWLFSSS
jgi:hypothetical protein